MHVLFVTGKLAEPSLRRLLSDLGPRAGFEYSIAVLPITVASLATTSWIARHLQIPDNIERVVIPGLCQGDLREITTLLPAVLIDKGPADLRDLPEFFGERQVEISDFGAYDISILAEINHAPLMPLGDLLKVARQLAADGADLIDLGCNPGSTWRGAGDAVRALRAEGLRVSIDSFDNAEVAESTAAGAELVLSVNSSNVREARNWNCEVVAVPDDPSTLAGLDATVERLTGDGVPFRIDPVLSPIGFGFAQSLANYVEIRQRYPLAEMMMGIGNLTELTEVDSAGINMLLIGFCEEVGIRSVLTTQVINWCRTSVREIDLARRLVFYAKSRSILPKHIHSDLVTLRDAKLRAFGAEALAELALKITDRNFRIFAEAGRIHVLNSDLHLEDTNPFTLFEELSRRTNMDPAHSFYLGYEMAKAVTSLTLGKNYTQDDALRWGYLTREEKSRRQ